MAYITKTDIKSYLGVDGSGDDTLLASLATRAQKIFETACRGRFFEASTQTRYFDTTGSRTLFVDEDLLTVTTLTNGDGTTIASADFQLLPLNKTPKYAIRLKQGSNLTWKDDSSGNSEGVISAAGTWGWSTEPPEDVLYAVIRFGALMYKNKDAQVFDVVAIPGMGEIIIPKGTPADVIDIIKFYRKPVL